MLIPIRKAQAGSDSLGHVWEKDGAVVRVSQEDASALLAIKDAGFAVADDSWSEPPAPGDGEDATGPEDDPAPEESSEFAEIDPKAATADTEPQDATKAPAKKTAARKTAASKPE